jgi:hypothetical protein
MPKLSKTRIINLNYNDGKRTIYNQVFDYKSGSSTLFSMDNGVGKTVLIQFFIQPFIKSKRDLSGRSFEDYFTNNTPTYIMHEIVLEGGYEKLLVGMVIKKETTNEDEKSKLRILAFTHKYTKESNYDIENIPFIETEDGVQKILRFREAEQKLKEYSRSKINFNIYNFNDNTKKNEYFSELDSYRINHKEWEEIIKKINNDESGLSNLFDKCKDDEALIKSEILPVIESKINGNADQIGSIKSNLKEYIESYKRSKNSIEEVKGLEEFLIESEGLLPMFSTGENKQQERAVVTNKLYTLCHKVDEAINLKTKEKVDYESLIDDLSSEMRGVVHEELSYEYSNYNLNIELLQREIDVLEENLNKLQLNNKVISNALSVQKASECFGEMNHNKQKLSEVVERISNFEKEDSEINLNIKNYKFTLNVLYGDRIKDLKDKLKSRREKLQTTLEDMEKEEASEKQFKGELINIKSNISSRKTEIENYETLEEKFKSKYEEFYLNRNPFFKTYEEKELKHYKSSIDKKFLLVENEKKQNNNEILATREQIISFEQKKTVMQEDQNQLALLNSEKKQSLKDFNAATKDILKILAITGLKEDVVDFRDKAREDIEAELLKLNQEEDNLQKQKSEVNLELQRLKTGFVEIPKDLKEELNERGIDFEHGLSWLKKYQGSFEEKKEIIKTNPFIPYSLLINKGDYEILTKENLQIFSSILIPIIDKNKLNESREVEVINNVFKMGSQDFLLSFNELLLDEEEKEKFIYELQKKDKAIREDIIKVKRAVENNNYYKKTLANYKYIGNEDIRLNQELKDFESKINKLLESLTTTQKIIVDNREKQQELQDKILVFENQLMGLKENKNKFEELLEAYQRFLSSLKQQEDLKEQEGLKQKALDASMDFLKRLINEKFNLELENRQLETENQEVKSKHNFYKQVTQGRLVSGEIHEIEGKLKACEDEYKSDLKRDKEDERTYKGEVDKWGNKLNKILKNSEIDQEYKEEKYDVFKERDLELRLNEIKKVIDTETNNKTREEKKISKLEGHKESKYKEIIKSGYSDVLSVENIKGTNFKERIDKIYRDLKEQKEIVGEYEKHLKNLEKAYFKLQGYREKSGLIVEIPINFEDYNLLESFISNTIGEESRIISEYKHIEQMLSEKLNAIYDRFREKNMLIKDRIYDLLRDENKIKNKGKLESLVEVVSRKCSVLTIELKNIRNEEGAVLEQITRYSKEVCDELTTIDSKSSIKFKDRSKKMLIIEVPEVLDEEGLKEHIKEKVNEATSIEGEYGQFLDSEITTAILLGKLIGSLSRIKVFIFKIEKSGLVRKSWKEAISKNSGGEKFVSMFILLASLLSYMRKKPSDIGNFEESKIIIMDNPFAKTNAEHLLEPMFEIANKYKIQLICFSGIGGSAVYNRFDVIYVAKVLADNYRNKENVEFSKNEDTLETYDFEFYAEQTSLI